MDKYYYLVAQLPMLSFGRESAMGVDSFLNEARKWMSAADFQILLATDIRSTERRGSEPGVLADFKQFEHKMRTEVVEWRKARKLGQEYKPGLFPVALVKEGNPLQVEKKQMEFLWKYLEELETGHHFDLEVLILYFLKLQLLARLESFNKEVGMQKFKHITEIGL